MPELKFVVDNSLMEGMRISNLVDTIIREDNAKHVNEDDSSVDDASNSDDNIKQADDKDS
jgi:ribosome-binding factor A